MLGTLISPTLDDAILEAIELDRQAHGRDLTSVYAQLQDTIEHISRDVDIETLLPGGPSPELGMAARRKNPQDFYTVFKRRGFGL